MKCLYSSSYIRLDSFYDQHIEVMLSESIHRFSTKDIYIQQKAMFIISYIYQKAVVKENCGYSYQKVLFVIELQIQQKVMFIIFFRVIYLKNIHQNLLYSYSFIFVRNLFMYLFIYFIYYFIYLNNYIVYRKEQSKEKAEKRLEENMITSVKLLKRIVIYKFV